MLPSPVLSRSWHRTLARAGAVSAALWLAACQSLPTPPAPVTRYDLGPAPLARSAAAPAANPAATAAPAVVLATLQAPPQDDASTAMRYRLAYADGQVLHAYSQARWSLPPAQLVQQRLRDHLGQDGRVVLTVPPGGMAPTWRGQSLPVLQVVLEEFGQVFTEAERSAGHVRLRASLVQPQPEGDVLLAQQLFSAQVPAQAANAAAGAQALAQSVDDIGRQLQAWLGQVLPARAASATALSK